MTCTVRFKSAEWRAMVRSGLWYTAGLVSPTHALMHRIAVNQG